MIQEISSSSFEQNTGVEQINTALTQLDNVIQQNASVAEETATMSETLAEQAKDMKEQIAFFSLSERKKSNLQLESRKTIIRDDKESPEISTGLTLAPSEENTVEDTDFSDF